MTKYKRVRVLWQPIISGLYLNYPGLVAWDMTQANALTVIQDPVEDVVQGGPEL